MLKALSEALADMKIMKTLLSKFKLAILIALAGFTLMAAMWRVRQAAIYKACFAFMLYLLMAGIAEAATPVLSVLAGNPYGTGFRDGQGAAASFSFPYGIAFDSAGNMYVANFSLNKLFGGPNNKRITTCAVDACFIIFWMYV